MIIINPENEICLRYSAGTWPAGTQDFIENNYYNPSILLLGSDPCDTLDSSDPIPEGQGAAYNLFSSNRELLLKAKCYPSSTKVEIGNGRDTTYVYTTAYQWSNNQWNAFTPACTNISGPWCIGSASASLPTSAIYYIAYICIWTGSEWKCGCHDQACTTNYWPLQGIGR